MLSFYKLFLVIMTIPQTLTIGKILDELIEGNNADYFIKKYKTLSKSYQSSVIDEMNTHQFIMRKNIFGVVETITIQEIDNELLSFGILSKERKEYNNLVSHILHNNYTEFYKNYPITYFSLPLSGRYIVGVGKDVQQSGDTLQLIMNKMLML